VSVWRFLGMVSYDEDGCGNCVLRTSSHFRYVKYFALLRSCKAVKLHTKEISSYSWLSVSPLVSASHPRIEVRIPLWGKKTQIPNFDWCKSTNQKAEGHKRTFLSAQLFSRALNFDLIFSIWKIK
jgi:hypothetical protein